MKIFAFCKSAFVCVVLLMCLGPLNAHADSNTSDSKVGKRLDIAARWLDSLCVLSQGDLHTVPMQQLNDELDAWVSKTDPAPNCKAPKPIEVDRSTVDLRYIKRLARVGEFRLQRQQLATSVVGVIQGEPSTTTARPLFNPQSSIYSVGGPVHFDEFYVGADVRSAVCALDKSFIKVVGVQDKCSDADYVAAGRKRDAYSRGLASITLDINFAQIPLFQNGLLVTDPAAINYPRMTKTVTGSFDPKKLFRSAAEWKALATNLKDIPAFDKDNKDKALRLVCGTGEIDPVLGNQSVAEGCLKNLTVGGKAEQFMLSVLPTVNVSATTPFELSKQGTSYRASDSAGESLYTVTASWNLRNIIAPASVRADALANLKKADPRMTPKLTVDEADKMRMRSKVSRMYIELKGDQECAGKDEWWDRFEQAVLILQ